MTRSILIGIFAAALSAVLPAGGCAAPILTMSYVFPPPAGVGEDIAAIEAGEFSVTGADDDGYSSLLTQRLSESLDNIYPPATDGQRESPGRTLRVSGTARIKITDTSSMRRIRRRGDDGATESVEVPAMIRTVDVEVSFVVTDAEDGRHVVIVEISRSYDSSADPRTRGDLGLLRADDPERVPAAKIVVRELLGECVDRFCAMVGPVGLTEDVALRWSIGVESSAGLAAAKAGDYAGAAGHFEDAAKAAPGDVDMLINLAAVSEAGGNLQAALKHYTTAVEQTSGLDPDAILGVRRVSRVLWHRERGAKSNSPAR